MKRKKWTLKEKLEILEKAKDGDVIKVCREHGLNSSTFYNWRKRFENRGEAGLKTDYDNRDKELKAVENENRILRKLLADKEVELEIQKELLKKKFGTSNPREL